MALKLPKLPNSISGDGRTFLSVLRNVLSDVAHTINNNVQATAKWQVTDLKAVEECNKSGITTIAITFNPSEIEDYNYSEVFIRRGLDKGWQFADIAQNSLILKDVSIGEHYSFKVIAVNKYGIKSEFENAPSVSIDVIGIRSIISTPKNFAVTFNKSGMIAQWDKVSDLDFFEFEVRTNTFYGSDNGLLYKGKRTRATIFPTNRAGTVYVYAINYGGFYSLPTTCNYAKPVPYSPKNVTVTKSQDDVYISFSNIPDDCSGANLIINNKTYVVTDNTFQHTGNDRVVSVQVAYFDIFGEGVYSKILNIEPPNVTGLTAIQLDTDRSIVKLEWNPVIDDNLSYYEVRLGTDWDSAAIIATRLKVTTFNYKASSEYSHTFLVRCFNIFGYDSSISNSKTVIITLRPLPPELNMPVQLSTDRATIDISWSASDKQDIDYYEIRHGENWDKGTLIGKTKETSIRYRLFPASTYNIMIRAVTVSNWSSVVANKYYSHVLYPQNVTGFTIIGNISDRRYITLSWTPVIDMDLLGYDIRCGTNWDTAIPVATAVKGNNLTLSFKGGSATYLIKAITISNYASEIACSGDIYVPIFPNTPPLGSAIADPNNRYKINLAWSASGDTDLKYYEIRKGTKWNSATLLGTTIDLTFSDIVATGSQHDYLVAAVTIGNQVSAPRHLSCTIVPEPSDIKGFNGTQDKFTRRVTLAWTHIGDPDWSHYEIRKGTSFSDTLLATNIKTPAFSYLPSIEETATYWIKAVTTNGNYSASATSCQVMIALVPTKPKKKGDTGITFDPRDKRKIRVEWLPIGDEDLLNYELCIGTNWVENNKIIIKETFFDHTLTTGGTVNFLVRSKNTSLNISQALLLTDNINIYPADINYFSAAQYQEDKSKVKLSWSEGDLDVAYFEIREGVSWDNYNFVVATRITGITIDTFVNEERNYNYWIKAFSVAHKPSQNAFPSGSIIMNMNPSRPENITVVRDPNDKTKVNISWSAISDNDIKEYEVRVGNDWNNADIIAITKELKTVWYPPQSIEYNFMVIARNFSNFNSDLRSTIHVAKIEPSNIEGFHGVQNGANSLLVWSKVNESDIVGYEIREGSNFDNGALIITGINTLTYQVPVDTERTYRYHIKAINRAGKYSLDASLCEVTITGLPVKNVIQSFDEITLQSGVHNNTEFGQSLINLSNFPGRFSDYPNTKFEEVGGHTVLKIQPKSLITDCCFDNDIDNTLWFEYATKTGSITKNARGNLLHTIGANLGTGIVFKVSTLERNTTYVVEYKFKSSKDNRTNGFIGSSGGYNGGQCNPTNRATNNKVNTWTTVVQEFTTPDSGVEPAAFLFAYGAYVEGDTIEIEYAKIHKKPGQTGIYTYWDNANYLCERKDLGSIITANLSSAFSSTILLTAGVNAKLQYRISRDGINFTDWTDFKPVITTFRYVDFRILLSTSDNTKTPEVNILQGIIDMPDIDKSGTAQISASGTTVKYGYTFWVNPSVIPTAIGEGLYADLVSIDKSSFSVKVKRVSDNVAVAGTISWVARGY